MAVWVIKVREFWGLPSTARNWSLVVLPARYDGEARSREDEEKHEGRGGAFPFPRFIFFELFFLLRAASLVNYLNSRNGFFFVCYWSLYSNLNTPINFRAGHPRKTDTIQFTALTKRFSCQLNWPAISSHLKRLPGKQFPLTDSMRIRRFHAYWSIFILKYFLKIYASPLLSLYNKTLLLSLIAKSETFLYRSRTSHTSHFRF